MSKPILQYKEERKPRNGFHASDFGKLEADLWLEMQGIPYTNPMEWPDYLRMAAGKGVELQMLKILKQNGIVAEDYNQDSVPTTEIERYGVKIRMKFDAQARDSKMTLTDSILPENSIIELHNGEPIEVKSINNKNSYDINDYVNGNPRENYVGQLAIYMDALAKDTGHLFVSSIDGLNYFWFVVKKIGEGKYQAGNVIVDIYEEYKRFAEIDKKIKGGIEPNWNQEIYKLPLEKIDWTQLSDKKISDARTNNKVIGSENSWKLLYSPYSDYILAKQGIITRGYTESEIETIKAATKGYSAKKK